MSEKMPDHDNIALSPEDRAAFDSIVERIEDFTVNGVKVGEYNKEGLVTNLRVTAYQLSQIPPKLIDPTQTIFDTYTGEVLYQPPEEILNDQKILDTATEFHNEISGQQ